MAQRYAAIQNYENHGFITPEIGVAKFKSRIRFVDPKDVDKSAVG